MGVSVSQWVLNDNRPYKITFYKVWSSGSQWESVGVFYYVGTNEYRSVCQWVLNDGGPLRITFRIVGVSGDQWGSVGVF